MKALALQDLDITPMDDTSTLNLSLDQAQLTEGAVVEFKAPVATIQRKLGMGAAPNLGWNGPKGPQA